MKKSIKQTLLSGAMILALSLAFTSCEDIFGHWEQPIKETTVFKKWNAATNSWETIDLSTLGYTTLTPQLIASSIVAGELSLTPGRYLVEDDVTIEANVLAGGGGALQLFLSNGKKLQINGAIACGDATNLEVISQESGALSVTSNTDNPPIMANNVTLDGGNVTLENTGGGAGITTPGGNVTIPSGTVNITTSSATGVGISAGSVNVGGSDVTTNVNVNSYFDGIDGDLELKPGSNVLIKSSGTYGVSGTVFLHGGLCEIVGYKACTDYQGWHDYPFGISLFTSYGGSIWDKDLTYSGDLTTCTTRGIKVGPNGQF